MWRTVVGVAQDMAGNPMPIGSAYNNKFQWLFLGKTSRAPSSYDRPIWETDHFAVLPSLGSIVSGWLLIVPKFPVCRIADLNLGLREEFEELARKAVRAVERDFGQAYLFEHGGAFGSKVSCGVDQAHLHIVPLDFDLLGTALNSKSDPWNETGHLCFPYDVCGPEEYWYVSNQERTLFMAISEPESQWFRKLIAVQTGQAGNWDYKEHPFLENVDATRKAIGADG